MKGKVIGVGFQKTGTSTLREALKILAYSVKDTTPRALIPILRGDFKKIQRILKGYDALEDTPWYMIYKELDLIYPGSKFVLTLRDEESWYTSVSKHIGSLRAAHHEWIYGRGKGLPKDHKENTIEVYTKHNEAVKQYFSDRPEDLLIVDFTKGDAWKELCDFLGHDIPEQPFPHANRSADAIQEKKSQKYKRRIMRHAFKNKAKIWWISIRGLWP